MTSTVMMRSGLLTAAWALVCFSGCAGQESAGDGRRPQEEIGEETPFQPAGPGGNAVVSGEVEDADDAQGGSEGVDADGPRPKPEPRSCRDYLRPEACYGNSDCRWLKPVAWCDAEAAGALDEEGCYPKKDCAEDSACGEGTTCQAIWVDYCGSEGPGSLCGLRECSAPALLCFPAKDEGCRDDGDCDGFASCKPQEGPIECGICQPSDGCRSDRECGNGQVCGSRVLPTQCPTCGGPSCVAACAADTDCLSGESCGLDGRCAPTTCRDGRSCPLHFACDAGTCSRRKCKNDLDCGAGACVNNLCYEAPGYCALPVP